MIAVRPAIFSRFARFLVCVAWLAGCGEEDGSDRPDLNLSVHAEWEDTPPSPAQLGYYVELQVSQWQDDAGGCVKTRPLPRVLANGTETALVRDVYGCVEGGARLGPFLEQRSLSAG
jgi:hypothetical protein